MTNQPRADAASEIATPRADSRRGLLDIKVALSHPEPTAGTEFTVYLLVTNPFDEPVWLDRPRVFLPSEMISVSHAPEETVRSFNALLQEMSAGSIKYASSRFKWWERPVHFFRRHPIEEALVNLARQADQMNKELTEKEKRLTEVRHEKDVLEQEKESSGYEAFKTLQSTPEYQELDAEEKRITFEIPHYHRRLAILVPQIALLSGRATVHSDYDAITVTNFDPSRTFYVYARKPITLSPQPRNVARFESSLLIESEPLQPGNTVVFSMRLTTTKRMFFRPIQYTLQYSMNFSFNSPQQNGESEETCLVNKQTNTISQPLLIRAPIDSVMIGACLGGIGGYSVIFLQSLMRTEASWPISGTQVITSIASLIVTVILSIIAVVFLARKSDTQSLIAVEDFWGGVVIGFLVGYTGLSAFTTLAGLDGIVSPATIPPSTTPTPLP